MKEQKQEQISISTFSKKGEGVGYFDDNSKTSVIVAHTFPGDIIEATLNKKRKGRCKGKLQSIIKPSPFRIVSPCLHAEICGGCMWMQMDYQEQICQKEKIVNELFSPLIAKNSVEMHRIIKAEEIFHYRNKMEFSFSENAKKDRFLGLMIVGAKKYVFNLQKCYLANLWMSDVLTKIRQFWEKEEIDAYNRVKNEGILRYLTMREGKNTLQKMVILTISDRGEWKESWQKSFLSYLDTKDTAIFLRTVKAKKGTPTLIEDKHLQGPKFITERLDIDALEKRFSFLYKISPQSFFQPNTFQAQKKD